MKYSRGFTLVELLVTLAVLAVVLGFGVPSFQNMVESNRVTSVTNSLVGLLNYARAEAMRHGRAVSVVPVDGSYANGVAAQIDGNDLRVIEGKNGSVTIAMTQGSALGFRANGLSNQSSEINYRICGTSGNRGTLVRVGQGGQIRSESLTCP